ncbi:cyclase family protein [Nonomuraea diastatica]|uniref:Cyclase family protein n=1 Tax=Nonomuraea diastatica TaxID=1848329 RepID=A0A4R4WX50_9ACTN|nr:cyclase family protein [Nonomuraea diastatica]TDD22364.1 cyclase family protein [Nonomuraea diastatica]
MIIELSHRIVEGMTTYPGVPAPELGVHLSREDSRGMYAPGTEFHIGVITLAANTGTYVDTPHHRYAGGDDLSQVPLTKLADLPGLVIRAEGRRAVSLDRALDVRGRAVLIHTGWDRHFGTEAYVHGHPHLAPESAAWLAGQGPALVGIDSLNIDDTPPHGERPAHSILLRAGIPIVEHLTGLDVLPDEGFRFHAAPPMVAGLGTFPVRAYAVVP